MNIEVRMPSGWIYHPLEGGLQGYWCESSDTITVGFVESHNPYIMLRFLAMLEGRGKEVLFPTVINARLAKLLVHRGYHYTAQAIYAEELGQWVDGYVKNSTDAKGGLSACQSTSPSLPNQSKSTN